MPTEPATRVECSTLVCDGDALRSQNWQAWEVACLIHGHIQRGDHLTKEAEYWRSRAAVRGLAWERWMKTAVRHDRRAREHYNRAKSLRAKSAKAHTAEVSRARKDE